MDVKKICFTFDLYDMTRKTTREKKFACWKCDSIQSRTVEGLFRSGELFFIEQFCRSVAKCRGSWVVGKGRGSWVWVVGMGRGCG